MRIAGQHMISTQFDGLGDLKRGKVRDVYLQESTIVMICCDRISVYDRILPNPIPDKGRILNLLANFWFDQTKDIIANHIISIPDPNITIAKRCRPLPIEVVVRGYLAGSIWRDYANGKREKCGISLPDDLEKHDPLPEPIITPTTKSDSGHDCDITAEEIIKQGVLTPQLWNQIAKVSQQLFKRGTNILQKRGMTLVDTKYEFGIDQKGNLTLIDEIHTPDSSRFWFNDDPNKEFKDKEFVRKWAAENGFTGEGKVPEIPVAIQEHIRRGYIDIYETVTGEQFPDHYDDTEKRVRLIIKREGYQL